jgi:two-component system, cell cycle sensor histidine kinase and response regulator CckA
MTKGRRPAPNRARRKWHPGPRFAILGCVRAKGKKSVPGRASPGRRQDAVFQHSAVSLWEEDITALRAAVRALQARIDVPLPAYLDAHPEFLREATRLVRVVDINEATLRLYEVQRKEDLLGPLSITLDLDDPVMLASIRDEILCIAGERTQYQHESTAVTPAGKKLSIIVEAFIPAEDDPYPHMLVSVIDVTEQRHAEQALYHSQQLLATLIDNLPDCVYLKDRESRFVLANRALARFMGVESPGELIGKTDGDFYPGGGADKFAADERCVMAEGRSFVNMEEAILSPTRGARKMLTTKVPLFDAEGRTTGLVGIGRDITEIRETEEALRRSEEQLNMARKLEAVGRLAGGIAHDFNNLLTVITGYADLLRGSLPEKSPLQPDLEQIKRSAQRAGALTSQLLAFSRRQARTPRVISLNEVVRGMEGMLARILGEDVRLVTRFAAGPGTITADPGQVEQVMMNLAANARDAMPLGGTITVETRNGTLEPGAVPPEFEGVPGEFVVLTVSDTGEGMDRETLGRIFEPFFTTKEMGKGTGLGLATVYGIVKQSGGFIFCDSAPGEGARFTLYFPRADEAPAGVDEPATEETRRAAAAAPRGGTETILLVEDEDAIRTFAAATLRGAGYTVSEAAGGSEALAAVSSGFAPDLLLTDVVMPVMNGRDLARRLQEARPTARVLYMTGHAESGVVHQGILDAGVALLQKPFGTAELLARVRRTLDAPGGRSGD